MSYDATFNTDRQEAILSELDGWRIEDNPETSEVDESINPFITTEEFQTDSPNKTITRAEMEKFYLNALNKALVFTNRLNIDEVTQVEGDLFIMYVCKWAASDLWNKYNIMVNETDMEATPSPSYGGVLYKQAVTGLKPFILTNLTTHTRLTEA